MAAPPAPGRKEPKVSLGSQGERRRSPRPREPRPRPRLPAARPRARSWSPGLADPPATARASALPSSVSFGGGSRDNLFLPGVEAGGGTGPAPTALPSAPSLPPSPLRQSLRDELLLRLLGSLKGGGRRGKKRGGRRVLETSAFHPSFGPRPRIQGSKLISFHVPLSPVEGKGRRRRGIWLGERGLGFGDLVFLPIPPSHPAASQASLENGDLCPSFPGGKG